MTTFMVFAWACGGGFAVSLLDYTGLHRVPKIQRRATFTDPAYLVKFFAHPFVGAFLAMALFRSTPCVINEVAAIIVGASGTKIIETIVRSSLGLQYFLLSEPPENHQG